jgi:L-alanine-DL-glutamate epimerase-like enolase superfamily enzyme
MTPEPEPRHSFQRRDFLRVSAASLLAAAGLGCDAVPFSGQSSGTRITRLTTYALDSRRGKPIGRNARLLDHGQLTHDILLRIETDAGIEGIGPANGGFSEKTARRMLGTDPLRYYDSGSELASPLGRRDTALWDLVGKLLGVPVWKLLGGRGPEWVPVYDGSFYFSDLDPAHAGRGISRILEEIDHSLASGHRSFKLKVGRGYRWMEPEAGLRRDVEVVRAARRHVGPDLRLVVDANDGYTPATARRFLEEADAGLLFVEELFPENVREDLALREWLRDRGWTTMIADGESIYHSRAYRPFIAARALDILQSNIHAFGLQKMAALSRAAAPSGISLAPNNFGSFLGFYLEVVLGRGIPNLVLAEEDPSENEIMDVEGFEFRDGHRRAPDLPGCGWRVREGALDTKARITWSAG